MNMLWSSISTRSIAWKKPKSRAEDAPQPGLGRTRYGIRASRALDRGMGLKACGRCARIAKGRRRNRGVLLQWVVACGDHSLRRVESPKRASASSARRFHRINKRPRETEEVGADWTQKLRSISQVMLLDAQARAAHPCGPRPVDAVSSAISEWKLL